MKLCMGCMNYIEDNIQVCNHCGYNTVNLNVSDGQLPPETILHAQYVVGKKLSQGCQGICYLGWDASLEHKVEIREYVPSGICSRQNGSCEIHMENPNREEEFQKGLSKFISEAQKKARLEKLDNLVHIYNCFQENHTGYIVMEYAEGEMISAYLNQRHTLSYDEACQLMFPVLETLEKMHRYNIFHLAIAPDSIMITSKGELKLLDSSMAGYRSAEDGQRLDGLKSGYAALEQYASESQCGAWTDVYGVAAVFYRMLTGFAPAEAIERHNMIGDIKTFSELGAVLPDKAERVLMAALAMRPAGRLQTAGDLLGALQGTISISELIKSEEPVQEIVETSKKKTPVAGIILVAVFIIATVGGIAYYRSQSVKVDIISSKNSLIMGELEKAFQENEEEGVIKVFRESGFQEENWEILFRYEYTPSTQSGKAEINRTEPDLDEVSQMNSKDNMDKKNNENEKKQSSIVVWVTSPDYVTITREDLNAFKTKEIGAVAEILENYYGFTDIQKEENTDYDDGTKGTVLEVKINGYQDSDSQKVSCSEKVTVVKAFGSKDQYEGLLDDYTGLQFNDIINRKKNRIPVTKVDVFGTGWGNYADGDIVKTKPKAGTTIIQDGSDQDQVICYVYNTGLDFEQLTESNIERKLRKYNLKPEYLGEKQSSTLPEGSIVYEDMPEKVKEGDQVKYWISTKSEPKSKPNVKIASEDREEHKEGRDLNTREKDDQKEPDKLDEGNQKEPDKLDKESEEL